LPAVGGPGEQIVVAEFAPEQGVVAEQVKGADPPVEFLLREGLAGGEERPESPQAEFLEAGLGGPLRQASLRIEVAREALELDKVHGFRRGCGSVEAIAGDLLRAEALEIPMADGPREHVEQPDVSGRALTPAKLLVQGTG
jgi:hypothetical protein